MGKKTDRASSKKEDMGNRSEPVNRKVIRLDAVLMFGLVVGALVGLALVSLWNLIGRPIQTQWALLGPVAFTLLGLGRYDQLQSLGKSIVSWRVREASSKMFLNAFGLVLASYLVVTLAWIVSTGFGYSGVGSLALAIFTSYYLLRMIDYRGVKPQTRGISFIPPILLLMLALLPPISLLLPAIQSSVLLQSDFYFVTLFFLFGMSTLAIYYDSKELKNRRPGAWVEIGDAGSYNMSVAYLFLANIALTTAIHPPTFSVQVLYLLFLLTAFLGFLTYSRPWFGRRAWLKKTKEGRSVMSKASRDNWLPETVAKSRFTHAVGEVVFFLAVTSLYIGIVLLYETVASPSTTSLLFGVLMLTSSYSMVSYGLRRVGLPFKLKELTNYVSARTIPDVSSLKQRLNAQISLFAGTLGVLLTLALGSPPNPSLHLLGAEIRYTAIVYGEFFVVLLLVFVNAFLRFQGFEKESQEVSPQFISSVNRITEWTFRMWVMMWGAITGSIALALGIPPNIDAPIVVAAMFVTILTPLYIMWIHARERRWRAGRRGKPRASDGAGPGQHAL